MTSNCRNCGEPVEQSYCPSFGQTSRERRGPLSSLLGDLLSEMFSLDGRLWRTAVNLWIPGRLTQLYLQGKRASYAPPVRVYLVTSLIFFLLVGFPIPDADKCNVYVGDVLIDREEPVPGLTDLRLQSPDQSTAFGRMLSERFFPSQEHLQAVPAQELLNGFFGSLEQIVPTTLIFFVPILAFALKLLYIRRPFFYVDHLIFGLHFQSALFQALVLAYLANTLGLASVIHPALTYVTTFVLIMTFYLAAALKRVYGQGWIRTLLKTGILFFLYLLLIQPILGLTVHLAVRTL